MTGAAPAVDLSGSLLWGTYRVQRLVGRGGMGAVYEAVNVRIGKRFAIKTLATDAQAGSEILQRFRREAQIATSLGHANIIDVVDFNETDDGVPCMVMEFLEGEDLAARMERSRDMTPAEIVPIALQVCSALWAAHQYGVIHRDVKPANIYLCNKGGQRDFVKVLDFGISKILGASSLHTRDNTVLGTPYYMAPEQAEGTNDKVGPWTDVFALGSILYQCLSGMPAFAGDSIPTLLYKVVHTQAPPLARLRPTLAPALIAAVERAMAKDPAERYQSMQDFATALHAAVPAMPTMDGLFKPVSAGPAASLSDSTGADLAATHAPLSINPITARAQAARPASAPMFSRPGLADAFAQTENSELHVRSSRRKRLQLIAGVAALCAAVLAGVLWLALRPASPAPGATTLSAANSETPSRPAAALPDAAMALVQATPPDAGAPPEVSIVLDGPSGTRVLEADSGKLLATLPATLRQPRSSTPLKLRAERQGFFPLQLSVVPDQDQQQKVLLKPKKQLDPERIANPFGTPP